MPEKDNVETTAKPSTRRRYRVQGIGVYPTSVPKKATAAAEAKDIASAAAYDKGKAVAPKTTKKAVNASKTALGQAMGRKPYVKRRGSSIRRSGDSLGAT